MKLPASDVKRSAGPIISAGAAMRFCSEALAIPTWNSGGLARVISVSVEPGARALTRMPWGANSAAIDRVKDISAAFPAAYMATDGENMKAPTDTTLSTAAHGLAIRWGSAFCTRKTGPRRLTSKDL